MGMQAPGLVGIKTVPSGRVNPGEWCKSVITLHTLIQAEVANKDRFLKKIGFE